MIFQHISSTEDDGLLTLYGRTPKVPALFMSNSNHTLFVQGILRT